MFCCACTDGNIERVLKTVFCAPIWPIIYNLFKAMCFIYFTFHIYFFSLFLVLFLVQSPLEKGKTIHYQYLEKKKKRKNTRHNNISLRQIFFYPSNVVIVILLLSCKGMNKEREGLMGQTQG